jgi:hypothetical protein
LALDEDDPAWAAADAEQAAYFRASLDSERQHVQDQISMRQSLIERGADTGHLRVAVHHAEAELRHLDRLIDGLDCRFASLWQDRD